MECEKEIELMNKLYNVETIYFYKSHDKGTLFGYSVVMPLRLMNCVLALKNKSHKNDDYAIGNISHLFDNYAYLTEEMLNINTIGNQTISDIMLLKSDNVEMSDNINYRIKIFFS